MSLVLIRQISSRPKPPPSNRLSGKDGVTLVEVMVALVVMGDVFVSAFATITQQVYMIEKARDYTRIAQILQSEIEDLRTKNWSDIEALASNWFVEISADADFNDIYGDRYRVWRMIRNRGSNSDQKEISVLVGWYDSNGAWNIKMTTTWFTEGGMNDYFYRSF